MGLILFPLTHTHTHTHTHTQTHTPGVDGGGKEEIRHHSYFQNFNFLIGKLIFYVKDIKTNLKAI